MAEAIGRCSPSVSVVAALSAVAALCIASQPAAFVSSPALRGTVGLDGLQGPHKVSSMGLRSNTVASSEVSIAVFGTSAILVAALARAMARRLSTGRSAASQRLSTIACRAFHQANRSPDEEALLRTIGNASSNVSKDVQRVIKECDSLPDPPKDALKLVNGTWKTDWNSVYGTKARKTLMSFVHEKLPGILVSFFDSYYRITDDKVEFVEAFTMAGNERVDAALVYAGKRKKATKKKGANQVHFQFETIQLCPADASTGMSREMLQSEGLGKFMKPVSIKEDATYIELDHVSADMQVHREESDNRWVLSKIACIPFILD